MRVVITGLGVVSCLGCSVEEFWAAVTAGRHGFSKVASFDPASYRCQVGAEVRHGPPREAYAFAYEAARQAAADAGLAADAWPARSGVAVGTTFGEGLALGRAMEGAARAGAAAPPQAEVEALAPGRLSARLAQAFGLLGPNATLAAACSAGNHALGYAYEKLRSGQAEAMLAGGVDVFSPVLFAGFNRLLATASERCAPFSKGRKGLIPGEGCGMLVLETEDSARRRGAGVYAEFLGCGLSSDASHVTTPEAGGVARAIRSCLERSGLAASEVDYLNAHGTGTLANDRVETAAIKTVFGADAARLPVSSIKSVLGHAMGAASALEAVACCLALKTGLLPPTAHFSGGDPDCDLDYVPDRARPAKPRVVLSNAFAFGGANAVVALAAPGARPAAAARPAARIVVTAAAVVEDADPEALARRLLPDADLGLLDRPISYALCAAARLLAQPALVGRPEAPKGIVLDSSGELASHYRFFGMLCREGPRGVEPTAFPNVLANAAASRAAIVFGLTLANVSLAGSFPGGESAVAHAADLLRGGLDGILLAGGVGEGGACLFAVERWDHALSRGIRPLVELARWRESFKPGVRANPGGCFCLAQAVEKAAGRGALAYRAYSAWGARVELDLKPWI